MIDVLKKEWQLYLRNWLLKLLISMAAGGLFGVAALIIIMHVDKTSTYIYLGTVCSMYVAGFFAFLFLAGLVNTRFGLLVSFGQKRSSVIWYSVAASVLMSIVLYVVTMIIYLLEKKWYPVVYAGRRLEEGFSLSFLFKYGLLVFVLIAVFLWMLYVVSLKIGGKIFAVIYLIAMAVILLIPRLEDMGIRGMDTFLGKVFRFLISISSTGWVMTGIITGAIFVGLGYNSLKRYDVRY